MSSEYGSGTCSTKSIIPVTNGHAQLIQDRVDEGWDPYLITFMFKPLPGGLSSIVAQMLDEIDRVYSTFLTRVVRNPRRDALRNKISQYFGLDSYEDNRPVLIACLDGFCLKRVEKSAVNAYFNDGRHVHGILVVPSKSRLKCGVREHVDMNKNLYVKNRLLRIDVRPIDHDLASTTDYALKALKTGRASWDDVAVFPKAMSEG